MRYAFIEWHRQVWPVTTQCRALNVSASGFNQYWPAPEKFHQKRLESGSLQDGRDEENAVLHRDRKAYRKLAEADRLGGAATLACCWAHLRREFFKLHADGSSQVATWTVEPMAELWEVEAKVKWQDPQTRLNERRRVSAPIILELQTRWESELPRISGKSKLAEAIRYGLTRKAEFGRFLEDGRIDIDNNSVERAIRPQTITRKNALFARSEAAGHAWATIASLLATARLNDIGPNAWLTQTLERIAHGWPNKDIDALLPWNFKNNWRGAMDAYDCSVIRPKIEVAINRSHSA
jgi:hypothetical protein